MRTETATRILDAIAAGKIHSLADSKAVLQAGAISRYASVGASRHGRGDHVTNAGWGTGPCAQAVDGQEMGPLCAETEVIHSPMIHEHYAIVSEATQARYDKARMCRVRAGVGGIPRGLDCAGTRKLREG